ASGALFRTMETVAEENPLRSATSRMVTAADCERLRVGSDVRRNFADEAFRVGFESADSMDSLNLASCWRTLQDDESSVKHPHDLRGSLTAFSFAWDNECDNCPERGVGEGGGRRAASGARSAEAV